MISVQTNSLASSRLSPVSTVSGPQTQGAGNADIPEKSYAVESAGHIPLSSPAGGTDCRGAQQAVSAFTALITLMCEMNRETYASRRDSARTNMAMRVSELTEAADKTRDAALTQGILGIVGGALSGVGAGISIGGGCSQLKELNAFAKTPPAVVQPQVVSQAQQTTAQQTTAQQTTAQQTTAQQTTAQQTTAQQTTAQQTTAQQTTAQQTTAQQTTAQQTTAQSPAGSQAQQPISGQAQTTEPPRESPEATRFYAALNLKGTKFSGIAESFRASGTAGNSLGQTISGSISAKGEKIRAGAEETKSAYDTDVSDIQQFQGLMSQFNQILASLLEAENKARSAAAQAC